MDEKIEFKIIIELDDEKLDKDNYDVADTYRIVRKVFDENEDLHPVPNDDGLIIYMSYYGAKDGYSGIGGGGMRLYDSWVRPYIKRMEWHNVMKNSVEDMLSISNEKSDSYQQPSEDTSDKPEEHMNFFEKAAETFQLFLLSLKIPRFKPAGETYDLTRMIKDLSKPIETAKQKTEIEQKK